MQVTLLAVGKLRPAYREACDDYLRRLGRHQAIVEREVREAGRAGTVERQRAEEAERLLKHVLPMMHVVLLDLDGRRWTSEQVAERLDGWRTAARDVTLVIGGAVGVDPTVAARANETWSLGPLTLPHELARVVVTEQLYRAMTILRGEPYHKGDR